jgi:OOP family OmpA-OmpF porin
MRDPLSTNPALLLAGMGIDTNDVVARWEPYVSTEPALLLARAQRALNPPGGLTLSMNGDVVVARGRAPQSWISRAEALAPALAGVSAVDLSAVEVGLPQDMETERVTIEAARVLFPVGSATLDDAARAMVASVASRIKTLSDAAGRNRYGVTLTIVGRTDPSGSASENVALSRRRAVAIRDELASRGVAATMLEPNASGSADPLPAPAPADRARINRSVSFVVHARPLSGLRGPERVR